MSDQGGCVERFSAANPERLLGVLSGHRRILVFGPAGSGKSTLAGTLCELGGLPAVSADPGSPAFGVPGSVGWAVRKHGRWLTQGMEAVCSLDAGRFRLGVLMALGRLLNGLEDRAFVLDAPGLVRGMAAEEMLLGLIEVCKPDLALVLSREQPLPLYQAFCASGLRVVHVQPSEQARHPGRAFRARWRTALWDAYLQKAREQSLEIRDLHLIGAPPPLAAVSAWAGRQVALIRGGRTRCMGEVVNIAHERMTIRLPASMEAGDVLLVRDAQRSPQGLLRTAVPFVKEIITQAPEDTEGSASPKLCGRVGAVGFEMLNGMFGDPLLHVRLLHAGRSLLFDLGMGRRLPARRAHQVSDVFITHAHIDHLGGFLWFLRSRIGAFPSCRMHGPPGLARRIHALMDGILWDRVGDRAPVFEVHEWNGSTIHRYRLVAGRSLQFIGTASGSDGVLLATDAFCVRACLLDHHTPVLAYAFEPHGEIHVRKERLEHLGLRPGPWLNELKEHVHAGETSVRMRLPDGSERSVEELSEHLVLVRPGKKWVYATDLLDSDQNRERLVRLANLAHTMFCEARFLAADAKQAMATGHLTTRACAEIAAQAQVARLVPFHFSQRYAPDARRMLDEIERYAPAVRVWRPDVPGESA